MRCRNSIERSLEVLNELRSELRFPKFGGRRWREDPSALRVLTAVEEGDKDLAILGSVRVETRSSVLDFDLRVFLLHPVSVRRKEPGGGVALVHARELGEDVAGLGEECYVFDTK